MLPGKAQKTRVRVLCRFKPGTLSVDSKDRPVRETPLQMESSLGKRTFIFVIWFLELLPDLLFHEINLNNIS